MAENPLITLARLAGGVVLMQGRLGHQLLGQMLVMNSHEVAVAGATVVVAATSGQRNAVGQAAVRTAAPALAAHVIIQQQQKRLEQQEALVREQARRLDERIRKFEADALAAGVATQKKVEEAAAERAALEKENYKLQAELTRLRDRVQSLEAAAVPPPPPVEEPAAQAPPEQAVVFEPIDPPVALEPTEPADEYIASKPIEPPLEEPISEAPTVKKASKPIEPFEPPVTEAPAAKKAPKRKARPKPRAK